MEVHLTLKQEARLARMSAVAETRPERLAVKIITRYLKGSSRLLEALEKGVAAAEGGDFIEEEEMDDLFERGATCLT